MTDQKSTVIHAVSAFRWESLKREYFLRTHITPPDGPAPTATVADPNAE